MALPGSGQLSFSAIYTELTGIAPPGTVSLYSASTNAYATINPDSAAQPNTTAPYAMSSWYSYDQSASAAYSYTFSANPTPDPFTSCMSGPGEPTQTLFSSDSAIIIGTVFYTDQGLTTVFDGTSQWWYSSGISYRISDQVTYFESC